MQVRIFLPPKTAMQSGRANTRRWVLEFEPESRREVEPLMGWTASGDMRQQLRLRFDTKEEAVAYAKKHGYMYSVEEQRRGEPRPKAYADNFRTDRILPWTH
ncbi:MAG: ETC complex I subunit [Kiloniellales bacterium]